LRTHEGVLERLYLAPPPDIESNDARELTRIAGLGLYVRRLGKQTVIDLARVLPMSIAELLDDWFESDVLKGLLGALGVWHLKQGPRSGGTAFNFLHHHAGSPAGVFRPARSNVTQALSNVSGVELRRGERAAVLAKNGKATGVMLEKTGDTISAPLVISSAPPRATLQAVAIELDPEFARAVRNIKARAVVARGTLALGSDPPYSTLCIAPSLDYLEHAYDDAKYGRDSAAPYVEVQRTDGRLELHVQYVAPATHEDLTHKIARALNAQPNQVQVQAAAESLYHGELTLDQILFMRPVPGWSRYRTPIEGLYLCGSGTHPGGGIPGAAGRNAAREIL
jgi:phytoene dehydrogenase-like protein